MKFTSTQPRALPELDSLILLLLRFCKKKGIKNLSKAQINKVVYLLEIEARKLTGSSFFESQINYHRADRGPISVDIKNSLDRLTPEKIMFYEEKGEGFTNPRHCHEIKDEKSKLDLTDEKIVFATSTFNILLKKYNNFNQKLIFKEAYATEPMKEIIKKEKGSGILKGAKIDFNLVPLDSDLLDEN